MTSAGDLPEWDVFVSHASADKPRVGRIAKALKEAGLRVWYDEWSIQPGEDIAAAIEQGLQRSRILLLCMSPQAFSSGWVQLERSTAIFRDPTNSKRRFIPVLLEESDIPDTIKRFLYLDLTSGKGRIPDLVRACKAAIKSFSAPEDHAGGPPVAKCEVKAPWSRRPISISASSDGQVVAWLDQDGLVYIHQRRTGVVHDVLELQADDQGILAITGSNVIIVASSGIVRALHRSDIKGDWSVSGINGIKTLTSYGDLLVVVPKEGAIKHLRVDTGKPVDKDVELLGSRDLIWPVDSDWYAARHRGDAEVLMLEHRTGAKRSFKPAGSDQKITTFTFDRTARYCLAGCNNAEILFFDTSTRSGPTQKPTAIFEGHSGAIRSVLISPDGTRAFSRSSDPDDPCRLWKIPSGELLATIKRKIDPVAFVDGSSTLLAVVDEGLVEIVVPRISGVVRNTEPRGLSPSQTRYTNAKVVLVGNSGVGKSGLANRLVRDEYVPTQSTHATDAWRLEVPVREGDQIEREVWLWDLAGQPDYKITHQLLLDDTTVAAFVMNPQGDDALAGVGEWAHALDVATKKAAIKPARLLVSARTDRGSLTVSNEKVRREMAAHGLSAHIVTSAATGRGCSDSLDSQGTSELKRAILQAIPWKDLPNIVTDRVIRKVKQIVADRTDTSHGLLLRFSELYQQVQQSFGDESVDVLDVRKAIQLLGNQHLVMPLEFGDLILLKPSVMNSYMGAVTHAAREHLDQIGCVSERDVLEGKIDLSSVTRLEAADEALLLRGLIKILIERAICYAADTDTGRQLIFPSLYRKDRPLDPTLPVDVFAEFPGDLDIIFARLVVKLWHGKVFQNKEIWKNAAEFGAAGTGEMVGFYVERRAEGGGRLNVFVSAHVGVETKVLFVRCIDQYLGEMTEDIAWHQRFVCKKCKEPVVDQKAVEKRLEKNDAAMHCAHCDTKIPLRADRLAQYLRDPRMDQKAEQSIEKAGREIDTQAKEQLLLGHMLAIAGEANQIFRMTSMFDYGIDGEIEFKNEEGKPSGRKIYVQLKSGDSYLRVRKGDKQVIFDAQSERHVEYWQSQPVDVYLVVRTSSGRIEWMNVSAHLRERADKSSRQIPFQAELLDAFALMRLRERLLPRR